MQYGLFVRRRVPAAKPRGVSLIELLAVIAILGIIFTIGAVFIGPPLKRAQLGGAANDLVVFGQRVVAQRQQQRAGQGSVVFIRAAPASRQFTMVTDATGDGQFQQPAGAGTDAEIAGQELVLPDTIVFYPSGASPPALPATYGPSWQGWSAVTTTFVLGVDFQNRAITSGGAQISQAAVVNLTHVDMLSGAVTPLVVYRISIRPVWGVRLQRLVRDAGAPTGWQEY
jgi:prepilin-type N-terminal cleavage/methylation domain-containing protein